MSTFITVNNRLANSNEEKNDRFYNPYKLISSDYSGNHIATIMDKCIVV